MSICSDPNCSIRNEDKQISCYCQVVIVMLVIIVIIQVVLCQSVNCFLESKGSQNQTQQVAAGSDNKAALTTHILDTTSGYPAKSVGITLYVLSGVDQFQEVEKSITDLDGRAGFIHGGTLSRNTVYKLHFDTEPYFTNNNKTTFYPFIEIVFRVSNPSQHYHVPLLLTNYGYTTYRGS